MPSEHQQMLHCIAYVCRSSDVHCRQPAMSSNRQEVLTWQQMRCPEACTSRLPRLWLRMLPVWVITCWAFHCSAQQVRTPLCLSCHCFSVLFASLTAENVMSLCQRAVAVHAASVGNNLLGFALQIRALLPIQPVFIPVHCASPVAGNVPSLYQKAVAAHAASVGDTC